MKEKKYFRRITKSLSEKEQIKILTHLKPVSKTVFADDLTEDTLAIRSGSENDPGKEWRSRL